MYKRQAKYLKTAYGAPQVDESTGAQLAFDNVLVLFTDIKLKNPDDPNNLVTDFAMSSGTGYYCYGGKFRAVTWETVSYTHLGGAYNKHRPRFGGVAALYLFTCHDAQVRGFFHALATVKRRTVCGRQKAEYSFLWACWNALA